MKEIFSRVEKHLYLCEYTTATGEKRVTYYARFTDWKGKHRKFPLGSKLKKAREELEEYRVRNRRHDDFDLDGKIPEPQPEPERLTVARYLPTFLNTKKTLPSYGFWKACAHHVERLLGPIALDEVTRSKIVEYKQLRLTEPIF